MANNFLVSCADPAMDSLTSSLRKMDLRASSYARKQASSAYEARMYTWVVPCTPFLVNISALFTKRALSSHSPHTVAVNLLAHSANHLDTVWLQVVPSTEMYEYNFFDSRAKDLERCGHLFCQVRVYKEGEAYIRELAASSLPGKKVVQLALNLIKACGVTRVLLRDGSKATGCCKEGTPCSLHAISAFKRGASWYHAQGARYNVATTGFDAYRAVAFLDSQYATEVTVPIQAQNRKPRHSLDYYRIDYDAYRGIIIPYYDQETTISTYAYRSASSYLHRLTVGELADSIGALAFRASPSPLETFDATLKKAIHLLKQKHGPLPKTMTVGHFLEMLEQEGRKDAAVHALMHDCRDFICGNRDSLFFQEIVDDLFAWSPSLSSLTYASVILDYWTHKAKGLSSSLYTVAYCQLFDRVKEQKEEYEAAAEGLKEAWKEGEAWALKEEAENVGWSPSRAKVVAAATKSSRDLSINYKNDMGSKDPFAVLEAALQHISQASPRQVVTFFPELMGKGSSVERHSDKIKLADLVKDNPAVQRGVARSIILASKESISSTIVKAFTEKEKRGSLYEGIYRRFMLAKYILGRGEWSRFTL